MTCRPKSPPLTKGGHLQCCVSQHFKQKYMFLCIISLLQHNGIQVRLWYAKLFVHKTPPHCVTVCAQLKYFYSDYQQAMAAKVKVDSLKLHSAVYPVTHTPNIPLVVVSSLTLCSLASKTWVVWISQSNVQPW